MSSRIIAEVYKFKARHETTHSPPISARACAYISCPNPYRRHRRCRQQSSRPTIPHRSLAHYLLSIRRSQASFPEQTSVAQDVVHRNADGSVLFTFNQQFNNRVEEIRATYSDLPSQVSAGVLELADDDVDHVLKRQLGISNEMDLMAYAASYTIFS